MYLIDTNIFLEILLDQSKRETCKDFLNVNIGHLYISDFSLHSIGVILFRNNKENVFRDFANDVIPKIRITTLPEESYKELAEVKSTSGLDFDDAYQFALAKKHDLKIVTMDKDFQQVEDRINIMFL